MTSRNPFVMLDRLRRAGVPAAEISRRTGVTESMLRKLKRGVLPHRDLRADQVIKLATLVREVETRAPVG